MIRNEKGSILVIALVFMMVLSFMLMAFLDMSNVTLKQTTYAEQAKKAFYLADGGLAFTAAFIDRALSDKAVPDSTVFPTITLKDTKDNIWSEMLGTPLTDSVFTSPRTTDLEVLLNGETAYIDIDKVGSAEFAAGSSGEFASGYEGIGGGMATGGVYLFYQVEAVGVTNLGAKAGISGVYRKVTGVGGGK